MKPRAARVPHATARQPERLHATPSAQAEERAAEWLRFGLLVTTTCGGAGLYWAVAFNGLSHLPFVGVLDEAWLAALALIIAVACLILLMSATGGRMDEQETDWNGSGADDRQAYDSVTGLPMTRLFTSEVNQAIGRSRMPGAQVAVLVIDLTEVTGPAWEESAHAALFVRVQAARVKSALKSTDGVGRLGKRVFGVLLDQVRSEHELVAIAKKIQFVVSLPFTMEGVESQCMARVGIGFCPQDGTDGRATVRAALQAAAIARADGYVVYGLNGAVTIAQPAAASVIAA